MSYNLAISELMVLELIRRGVDQFVISPGSRSTPLTVAIARNPDAKTITHFDERGAAFFALGHARATRKPAVLVCTSGTAVANYYPAIIEASIDNIPLIVLSADRPPELIDVGANQAIFQENIYGRYPRLFKNLPPPESDAAAEAALTSLNEIYDAATGSRPGPVHLNCQFREPLLPADSEMKLQVPSVAKSAGTPAIQKSTNSGQVDEEILSIVSRITAGLKGLIVVGRSLHPEQDENILSLALALNWPILPDVQSRLRFQRHPHIINHFDLLLLKDEVRQMKPDMIIHLGSAFTSKRLLTYLNDPDIFYVSIKETSERIDPNHQVDLAIQLSVDDFSTSLTQQLRSTQVAGSEWLSKWQEQENTVAEVLDGKLDQPEKLSEPAVSYHLSKLLPPKHSLMLANSMAIREMEMFAVSDEGRNHMVANRGASGIDGLIATAIGYQLGSEAPLTFLTGDLAALHDLNSLALIKNANLPLVIILVNNDGGGIFNFLPVLSETDVFEPFFGTPHGLTFKDAAAMFHLDYSVPKDVAEFKALYSQAIESNKATIIEIQTDRYENHQFHKYLFDVIREI